MKLLIILLFIISSCSSNEKNYKYDNSSKAIGTISIDDKQEDTDKKLEIEKNTSIGYGPSEPNGVTQYKSKPKRIPAIALNLLPALYSSYAYIVLLKKLEKNSIKPNIVISSGFGAVITALYAKKSSTSYLEWKVYELTSKLKGIVPYTKEWMSEIHLFIDKEFKEERIEQFQTLFGVAQSFEGKGKILISGKASQVLKKALNVRERNNYLLNPVPISRELSKIGSDITVNISSFPARLAGSSLSDYYWGIYTHYAGELMSFPQEITYLQNNQLNYIDVLKPASTMKTLFNEQAEVLTNQIIELRKSWQEEISSSSN